PRRRSRSACRRRRPAAHCAPNHRRLSQPTCSATPSRRRKLPRPINYLRFGTVEDENNSIAGIVIFLFGGSFLDIHADAARISVIAGGIIQLISSLTFGYMAELRDNSPHFTSVSNEPTST